MNVEILEFVRPDGPQHSLYITGISQLLSHNELYVSLLLLYCIYQLFYWLLYAGLDGG